VDISNSEANIPTLNPEPRTIDRLARNLLEAIRDSRDESDLLSLAVPLVRRAAVDRSWLRPEMYRGDPEQGFGTTVLHAEPDHSLFIVVDAWLPGCGVRPHDHGTWAVVVGVEGTERNTFWERVDDGTRKGFAELRKTGEAMIGEGEAVAMRTGEIHSVVNETEKTTLSFHVYGRHLNHTGRSQYDVEGNLEIPFLIETR